MTDRAARPVPEREGSRVATFVRSGSAIAVAMAVMNAATYGYTLLAARLLGPQSYGAFAALMGLMLVVSVLQLGLQAVGARRIASTPGDVHRIEAEVLRVGWRSAWGLTALLLVLAPVIDLTLRLDSLPTAGLVAVTALPLTVMGAQAGILQGERRWLPLALVYLASGLPRLLIGTGLIVWRPTELVAMLGVAIGAYVPIVVGARALRRPRSEEVAGESAPDSHSAGAMWRETLHNSHALLAFFALSNIDLVVARNVLDAHDAGLYAGGAILIKAMLFLPQFIVVLAFPSMATEEARREAVVKSLALVALLGVLATAATVVLSGLALSFVGGHEYADVRGSLWVFAAVGTVLSMLQLLVYNVIAEQAKGAVFLVWAALIAVVVAAQFTDGTSGLLLVVSVADTLLFLTLLVLGLRGLPRRTGPAVSPTAESVSTAVH